LDPKFATTTSGLPSPFKSAAVTPLGVTPAGRFGRWLEDSEKLDAEFVETRTLNKIIQGDT
jgi:hypothetical protein